MRLVKETRTKTRTKNKNKNKEQEAEAQGLEAIRMHQQTRLWLETRGHVGVLKLATTRDANINMTLTVCEVKWVSPQSANKVDFHILWHAASGQMGIAAICQQGQFQRLRPAARGHVGDHRNMPRSKFRWCGQRREHWTYLKTMRIECQISLFS